MLKIIESQNKFGTMNAATVRYSNLTEEDRDLIRYVHQIDLDKLEQYDLSKDKDTICRIHHKNFGNAFGFDGDFMYSSEQKGSLDSSIEITPDYVESHPTGSASIHQNILIVTSKTPRVVIGHPVSDCPVVMMCDKKNGVSAISHCSGEMIDQKLPMMIVEALRKGYGSKVEDIFAYVSACAGDGWIHEFYPSWAKDSGVWSRSIIYGEDNRFHINIKPAILMQLIFAVIDHKNIRFNLDDTISHPGYYSSFASSKKGLQEDEKYGKHFAGLYYDGEEDQKIRIYK